MRFRFWVCISAGLFAAGVILGFLADAYMPDSVVSTLSGQMASLEQLSQMLQPFEAGTALFIFLKNLSVLVFGCLFAPLLGLFPALSLLANGTLLSFVAVIVARETSAGLVLAAILPHGIFEIPAIVIGEAAAFSIGFALIMAVFKPERRAGLEQEMKRSLRYLLIAGVLLVPASVIETFVTPLLLRGAAP
jgi:stage II sporulation protein M